MKAKTEGGQESFKAACWNDFIKQDEYLNGLSEEGEFAMDMARIMPNDFDNLNKVCHGKHEGECFHSWEEFIRSQFEMKEDGRGDFYKFTDDWFIVDCNNFLVSSATVDEMIDYIIQNSGIDMNDWKVVRNSFDKYFEKALKKRLTDGRG